MIVNLFKSLLRTTFYRLVQDGIWTIRSWHAYLCHKEESNLNFAPQLGLLTPVMAGHLFTPAYFSLMKRKASGCDFSQQVM